MDRSPSSASLFLPFGSLTGVIPVDAIQRGRVVGDFGSVLGSGQRTSDVQRQIHSAIDPGRPTAVETSRAGSDA